VGFAALLLGATPIPGAEYFLDLLDFDAARVGVDLVVTGEGSLDHGTQHGKLVAAVARRAASVPVVAVVGRNRLARSDWERLGLRAVHSVSERADSDLSSDPVGTQRLLEDIGTSIATEWLGAGR
jgi:glycerate 2-kinase